MEPPEIKPKPAPASEGLAYFLYYCGCAVVIASIGFAVAMIAWAVRHA